MKRALKKSQQGLAAILFVLMVPILFSLFALATDGGRAMQDSARLNDALEAASLAVAAYNDDNDDSDSDSSSSGGDSSSSISGSGSSVNKQISKAYINRFMSDMDSITSIDIVREECNSATDADCSYSEESTYPTYYQYSVKATTKHSSWFGDSTALGDSFNVSSDSTARKYQNQTVDIVFVSDFSGSMGNKWTMSDGTQKTKYVGVIEVIKEVVETLDEYNNYNTTDKNTAAFVPYSKKMQASETSECDYLKYKFDDDGDKTEVKYTTTVNNVFTNTGDCSYKSRDYYLVVPASDSSSLTNDLWGEIKNFEPGGYTASFQGVIKGAQILQGGVNEKKLMIILSDGADYGKFITNNSGESSDIAEELYGSTNDMCGTIKSTLDGSTGDVETKITVIGFGYNASANTGLQLCAAAGGGEVYEAEDFDDVKTEILKLIVEEIGHLR